MQSLNKIIDSEVKKLPYYFLEKQIQKKLDAAGIPESDRVAKLLIEHNKKRGDEPFTLEGGTSEFPRSIELAFSENDIQEIENNLNDFLQTELPNIVEQTIRRTASELLLKLEKEWPDQFAWEEGQAAAFRERLEKRWGRGLTSLRMLLTIAREIGVETSKRYKKSKSKKFRFTREALLRLHARSCQVTAEIITLLENGFADGAMARWRTLYEISVVSILLAEHGEELSERYVAHQIVESKRALDEYVQSHSDLGHKPVSQRHAKSVQIQFSLIIGKFGKDFGKPYGWAAKLLNKQNPNFADLEVAARRGPMRPYYKLASYNVHAGAKGIYYKLGDLDGSTAIAGASNAGLSDPGQNAAISLTSISIYLMGARPRIDETIAMQTLSLIRDKAIDQFVHASRRLDRDHKRHITQRKSRTSFSKKQQA